MLQNATIAETFLIFRKNVFIHLPAFTILSSITPSTLSNIQTTEILVSTFSKQKQSSGGVL